MRAALLAIAVALMFAAVGRAQGSASCRWWTASGGALWTLPESTEKQTVESGARGFTADAGLGGCARPQSRAVFFLTGSFLFDDLRVKGDALQAARIQAPTNLALQRADDGRVKYTSVMVHPTVRIPGRGSNAYVFGGVGWLRRSVDLTASSTAGALLQPGNPAVLGSTGNSAALDAGVGVNLMIPRAKVFFYLEARVLHGLAINHTTTLVPLSAGFRF